MLLSQLAARYRTPRLLRHVLGLAEDALPPVEPLAELPPPPDVRLERIPGVSGRIRVRVSDRGGGIGRVVYRSEGPFEVLLEPLRPVPGEPGVFAGEIATGSPAGATTFEVRAFGLGDHVRSRTRFITIDER